jgi:hypothetical protein
MAIFDKVSTGLKGFDQVIDNLRPGDNVVWQVDSASDYEKMVTPYVREAKIDNRNLVYIRFGRHKPIVADDPDIKTFNIEPGKGFELFANEVHNIIKGAGKLSSHRDFIPLKNSA